jgi:hypothetical protein
MISTHRLFQLIALLGFSLASSAAATGDRDAASGAGTASDERAIYNSILSAWLDGSRNAQMVDRRLGPPPSAAENAECTKGVRFPKTAGDAAPDKDLDLATFRQANVELVDGDNWEADDPERSMAQGKTVDAAVKQAFAHSLISFSQIAFSVDGQDALVSFGMSCGRLCGHGFTVRMHKAEGRWKRAAECGSYMN